MVFRYAQKPSEIKSFVTLLRLPPLTEGSANASPEVAPSAAAATAGPDTAGSAASADAMGTERDVARVFRALTDEAAKLIAAARKAHSERAVTSVSEMPALEVILEEASTRWTSPYVHAARLVSEGAATLLRFRAVAHDSAHGVAGDVSAAAAPPALERTQSSKAVARDHSGALIRAESAEAPGTAVASALAGDAVEDEGEDAAEEKELPLPLLRRAFSTETGACALLELCRLTCSLCTLTCRARSSAEGCRPAEVRMPPAPSVSLLTTVWLCLLHLSQSRAWPAGLDRHLSTLEGVAREGQSTRAAHCIGRRLMDLSLGRG